MRAYQFGLATFDSTVKKQCYEDEDPSRLLQGVPDRPYSFMEGLAGHMLFIKSLL
jgi:hypothetical protein